MFCSQPINVKRQILQDADDAAHEAMLSELDAAECAQHQREAAKPPTVRDEVLWAGVEAARVADQSLQNIGSSQGGDNVRPVLFTVSGN